MIENSPHNVGRLSLDVTFLEEEDDDDDEEEEVLTNPDFAESDDQETITINVSGNLPSKEALSLYFENERRSGGGEVLNMECNDDGVVITFAEVKGKDQWCMRIRPVISLAIIEIQCRNFCQLSYVESKTH